MTASLLVSTLTKVLFSGAQQGITTTSFPLFFSGRNTAEFSSPTELSRQQGLEGSAGAELGCNADLPRQLLPLPDEARVEFLSGFPRRPALSKPISTLPMASLEELSGAVEFSGRFEALSMQTSSRCIREADVEFSKAEEISVGGGRGDLSRQIPKPHRVKDRSVKEGSGFISCLSGGGRLTNSSSELWAMVGVGRGGGGDKY
jgi:hypothetical protein